MILSQTVAGCSYTNLPLGLWLAYSGLIRRGDGNADYVPDSSKKWPKKWSVHEAGTSTIQFCVEPGSGGCLGIAGDYPYSRDGWRLFSNSGSWSNMLFRGTNLHNGAKNLVLDIAQAARQDMHLGGVHVHAIGLGGYGYDADAALVKRMANDPSPAMV